MKLPTWCQTIKFASGVFFTLLFFGTLFWARHQDPFSRKWFTLKAADGNVFKCVAILPKLSQPRPVVIYAHNSGGNLMDDGFELRQMAELGLTAISFEYNQGDEVAFTTQFETLLQYLNRQTWAGTNSTAWVGFSLGANRMMNFACQHREQQPQLLIQLSGSGMTEGQNNCRSVMSLHCPVLLIHGGQDEILPVADTRRLASFLRSNGVPVGLTIIPSLPHDMEPDQGEVFRSIGEYCLAQLTDKGAWHRYNSILRWQAAAPPFWSYCLPAVMWASGWLVWWRMSGNCVSVAIRGRLLTPGEIILRWLAAVLAIFALGTTAIHLATPHFAVGERTLSIARKFLVQSKEKADFEVLACRPIWSGQKLRTLLEHVELAGYTRALINWPLDDEMYRDFVLSPVITGDEGELLDWRRTLWEEFYPRIRHESSPEGAARIVVRHLRERVTIVTLPNPPRTVPEIWLRQITDEAGFQIIYVAALRSVGVPARLDAYRSAELYDGSKWQSAPSPVVVSWLH